MATVAAALNTALQGRPPSFIIPRTVGAIVGVTIFFRLIESGRLYKRIVLCIFRVARQLLKPLIQREIDKASSSITFPQGEQFAVYRRLPSYGMPSGDLMTLAHKMHHEMDVDYHSGAFSGTVYHGRDDHTQLMNDVMALYQWSNPLHVDAFPSVRKMEAEICAMVVAMYHGDERACAALTSGGTESICMAVKAYREWGRATLGVRSPTIVLPITAHPAFDKAAHYYGVALVKVPVGSSGAVDVADLAKHIRPDTVAIVGSAPTFPHGTYDDIVALANIARNKGIGLHVDACLGGFINPFLERAGFEQPLVDFRVDGVTSISCDTHKYGFAPKGTSVVMYATPELRQFQFFTEAEWPGGMYCSPGAPGSRAGNVIAATWAAMVSIGGDGYTQYCRDIVVATRAIEETVRNDPSLHVLGTPRGSVISFSSSTIDIFELHSRMRDRGWHLNPLQFPSGVQISVTLLHAHSGVLDKLTSDLSAVASELRDGATVSTTHGASMYGSQQRIPDRSIIAEVMVSYLNKYYRCPADPPPPTA